MPEYSQPPDPVPMNRARKVKSLKKFLQEVDFSESDVRKLAKYLLTCSAQELKDIIGDINNPIIVTSMAASLLNSFGRRSMSSVESLINYAGITPQVTFGSQELESTVDGQFHEYKYPEAVDVE